MKISKLIQNALAEDKAYNDITTKSVIPKGMKTNASLLAKQDGIICGLKIFAQVFSYLDPSIKVRFFIKDGAKVRKGKIVAKLSGSARALLSGERTALNFIQHMSGIATLTAKYAGQMKGTKAKILDTRKTAPGLREIEKYAVSCGGGFNHRLDLSEMALIKDNHLKMIKNLPETIKRMKKKHIKVEIEAETISQAEDILNSKADIIMLDNMSITEIRKVSKIINEYKRKSNSKIKTEISGGVNLKNVREYAKTGVDRISVGALTHSAPALDLSLEIQ